MKIIADLHLHGKYSRAVSKQMTLPEMAKVGSRKGIDLFSTADFTHPIWLEHIREELVEDGSGILKLKKDDSGSKFILSTEISSIYKQNGKLRRIHSLIFAPSIEIVEKIIVQMNKRTFNLRADGRPIIGLSARDLLELILSVDENCFMIPAHAWTPHFGLYGSASGFDSIDDCFADLSENIYAIETGLSSDPEMNWMIPELNSRSIVSTSDAHSLPKMGREATVFEGNEDFTYYDILESLKRSKKAKLNTAYTIEFYPEEGKYHFSGHRNCKISMGPEEITKSGDMCPVCSRKLTEGVFVRLKNLSGGELKFAKKNIKDGVAWYEDQSGNHAPYVKLVPLLEIVAESLGSTAMSQKSHDLYEKLLSGFGSEFDVLMNTKISDIQSELGDDIAEGIDKVRRGDIYIKPGYDGEFGKVSIWKDKKKGRRSQMSLGI